MTVDPTPDAMLGEAARLREAGRAGEAAAAYETVLARWPDLPNAWFNLALMQKRMRRFDEALASYQQAIARGVEQPEEAHLNRGVIFADNLARPDAAETEYTHALALNPNYAPALMNLANLHEDRGQRAEARALYERVLALEPDYAEALARLANLTPVSSLSDPLVARLKHALTRPHAALDKASLGFALGRALDAGGAYDDAFAAYTSANAASRESAGPRVLYDPAAHERFIDQLIAAFPLAETAAPAGNPPVFVCGMFRSGSTLTEQVLAGHPNVSPGGELEILPAIVDELAPFPASLKDVRQAKLDAFARRYLAELARRFPSAQIVTDKRPDNFLYIGLIKSLFPHAKIVHTTRDALDNCLSIFFLHLDHAMGYALSLEHIAHYYRQYRRLMAHWKGAYAGDIFDFDYDGFVRDPRASVERLIAFLGLGWDEALLAFHDRAGVVKTASVWQVREPLYQRSSGRWRAYEQHLARLRAELGDLP